MIQPLRKVHRWVFVLLAIVLPLLFIAGLRARHHLLPEKVSSRNLNSSAREIQVPPKPISASDRVTR
jgi:hypothetical protein